MINKAINYHSKKQLIIRKDQLIIQLRVTTHIIIITTINITEEALIVCKIITITSQVLLVSYIIPVLVETCFKMLFKFKINNKIIILSAIVVLTLILSYQAVQWFSVIAPIIKTVFILTHQLELMGKGHQEREIKEH